MIWNMSYERPWLPKTCGSSFEMTTGTELLRKIWRGWLRMLGV